jgi:multiple sugar transport system permease protein
MSTVRDALWNGVDQTRERSESVLSRLFEGDRMLVVLTVGPAVALMTVSAAIPVVWALYLSMHEAGALDPNWTWIGFGNYLSLFGSSMYWEAFRASFVFGFGSVGLQLVVGLVTALLLTRKFRGVILTRALVFLPYLIPTVVVGMIFRLMMNEQFGIINIVAVDLGIIDKGIAFLGEPSLAMPSLIVLNSWKFSIFITMMVLARLQSIPDSFYEAATMNGAGPIRKFRDITYPQIRGVLLLVVLLRGVWMFNKFDIIWIVTGGGPGRTTETLPVRIYRVAFINFDLGMAGAISGTLFAFLGLAAVVYFAGFKPAEEVQR